MAEKQLDLESFRPNELYKSEDELIWDILYDAIVFNRRNTFIQIYDKNRVVFKTANLKNNLIKIDKTQSELFDYYDSKLSEHTIRTCNLKKGKFSVVVAYPIEQINFLLNKLIEIYILIAPFFFLVSILGGILISIKSLNRINKIIAKTEEITAQNLDEIILGGDSNDEFGRLVNKMNEMILRIKKSIKYMNQFSLAVAHELKTPLTILQGEIEIALKSPKTSNEYQEILKSNYEETLRLIRIVDNLFYISKSEHSLINLQLEEVELKTYLESLMKKMKILGDEKNMNIELGDVLNIKIRIDPDLIKQALTNLIDNAFKFGIEGSTVKLYTETINEKLSINVMNFGVGIDISEINNIFNKFYRAGSYQTNRTKGVGLGLSVVKSIIELHKGKLEVQSIPHNYTIFKLIFNSRL
ncbi:MAG: HAMP domain-containing histidine kinase [Melioribacteraceae bacterium]|nr:HAMP domain-containing histidine kinase [Melioribacteraceae bacterium]